MDQQPAARINQQVTGRDNIVTGTGDVHVYALPPMGLPERAHLNELIQQMRAFWIDGVLAHSVRNAALIDLEISWVPEAVRHPRTRLLALHNAPIVPLDAERSITEVFQQVNRRLLVLGAPGAGKTTALLELARDLLDLAQHDPAQPIPIVLNLSTWSSDRSLAQWILGELSSLYDVGRSMGRAWLEQGRLIPLFDGLDEIRDDQRSGWVEAFHAFLEEYAVRGVVVCSRREEYMVLPVRLRLGGAVCLEPLTQDQVDQYLAVGGPRLAALREQVRDDAELRALARSPLMISIMALTFADAERNDFSAAGTPGKNVTRDRIFSAYVDRMLMRETEGSSRFDGDQVRGFLARLAHRMESHSLTIFTIEQVQPSWLGTANGKLLYALLSRMSVAGSLGVMLALEAQLLRGLDTPDLYLLPVLAGGAGALVGIVDGMSLRARSPAVLREWRGLSLMVLLWIVLGTVAVTFALPAGSHTSFSRGLAGAALLLLLLVPTLSLGSHRGDAGTDINLQRMLAWSGRGALRGALWGGGVGGALLSIAFTPLFESPADWLIGFPGIMVIGGGLGAVWGATIGGLRFRPIRMDADGWWQSNYNVRNALISATAATIIFSAPIFVLAQMLVLFRNGALNFHPILILLSLIPGFLIGLYAPFWFGGTDVMYHWILRVLLAREGVLPYDFRTTLDHATKRVLMQKVGPGYIFVHRLLLEHFAHRARKSADLNATAGSRET